MARLSHQLWDAAKNAERGYQGQGPDSLLSLTVRLANGASRKDALELLASLGASRVAAGKTGPIGFSLPAASVIELARVTAIEKAALADAPRPKIAPRRLAVLLLGLVLLATSAAGMAYNGPGYWVGVAKDALEWVGEKIGSFSHDGVPRRWKPKPKRPGGVAKRVKPEPPRRPKPGEPTVKELYHQGLLAYHKGRKEEAVRLWQKALDKDPKVMGVRHQLGWALYEMNQKEKAKEQFRRILEVNPGDEGATSALQIIQRDGDRNDRGPHNPADGP